MSDTVAGEVGQLRQRIRGWRAAERREQTLRTLEGPMQPAAALAAADELYDLALPLLVHADLVRSRELAEARAAWRSLRARLGFLFSSTRHP